jgi:co-chaperonin GroES (HSP10)
MDWIPLYDKIIVKRDPPDETLGEGTLAAADAFRKPKNRGTVVCVGKGRISPSGLLMSLMVQPGDRVLFGQHSGIDIEESAKDHVMLREDEVLAFQRS